MIYQVRADLKFDSQDEARDFYHDCELAFGKSASINALEPNEEPSTIELIENHHDQNPAAPCLVIANDSTRS